LRALTFVILISWTCVFGDEPTELAKVVAALNGSMTDRAKAFDRLLERKDPAAVELIETAIPGFGRDGQVNAVKLLRALPESQGRPALRRLLKAESAHPRFCAAVTLFGSGEPEIVTVMTEALNGKQLRSRDLVGMALSLNQLGGLAKGGAGEALVRQGANQEFFVEMFLWPTIRGMPESVHLATVIAEQDKRAVPRALAAAYLVRHRKSDYAAVLGDALADDEFPANRFPHVRTILLTRVGAKSNKPPEIAANVIAVAASKQRNGELAASMLYYLYMVNSPKLRALCLKLVEHPSSDAALAALKLLAGMKLRPPDESLLRMIEKGSDAAALEAASLLLRVDDDSGFERVMRCARDNQQLRSKAIVLLGEYGKPQAMDLLLDALEDQDFAVRSAAFGAVSGTMIRLFPYREFRWPNALRAFRGDPAERTAAIAQMRAWWAKHKDADW